MRVHVSYELYLTCLLCGVSLTANADIFFDATLHRLSGSEHRAMPRLHAHRTVLALLKWAYFAEDETISLHVRTDSQGKCRPSTALFVLS
jgi:hypothetical protein